MLLAPTMETGMKEDIKKKHGYYKTKESFFFDEGLAERQAPILTVVRPIVAALEALDFNPEEDEKDSGPESDDIKVMLEDTLALLGNAVFRLNAWRQRRFSEYLTDLDKRTLKSDLPSDKHLFLDSFHKAVQSEHDHPQTNSKLVAAPVTDKSVSKKPFANKSPFRRQPFQGPPMKRKETGEIDGATPKVLLKPKTSTVAITQATMTKTRADYALPFQTPPPRQLPCMTGRLKHFQANWRKITNDPWLLQTISSYRLSFIKRPGQIRSRITRAKTLHQQKLLQDAITELIKKQAIKMVTDHQTDQFISTLFVLQQTNKTRPVFNLRQLNSFVETPKFKMEGLALLRSTLRENDYMTKLDLKDTYFSIPIAVEHRRYLRFIFNDLLYEF